MKKVKERYNENSVTTQNMNNEETITHIFVGRQQNLKTGAAETSLFIHEKDMCVGGEVETLTPDIDRENDHIF